MQVQSALPKSKLRQRPKARHRCTTSKCTPQKPYMWACRRGPLYVYLWRWWEIAFWITPSRLLDHSLQFETAFLPLPTSYFDAVSTVSTGPTDWQIMIVQFFWAASSSCIFQRCFSHLMLNLISISSRWPPQHQNHRALINYVTSSTSWSDRMLHSAVKSETEY